MEMYDTIIVGAGLAGLTSGLELAHKGKKVLLLEAEPIVGGRTSSYNDNGMEVESGFHRYIGFYAAMPKMLRKAGIHLDDIVTWEDKAEIRVKPDGRAGVLGMAPLFGPIKTLKGIFGNTWFISPGNKLSLMPFLANGLNDYLRHPDRLDTYSVRDYARAYGVSEEALRYLLVPLSSGLFFLPPERYSALAFFGLLTPAIPRLFKMRIGAFLGGMTDIMCRPIAREIEKKGGIVRTGEKVQQLITNDAGTVTGVKTQNGELFEGKHVVLATALNSAKELLKPVADGVSWFDPMFDLPSMPAVTIQIDLKRPALEKDVTTFGPETSMVSFAEQSRTTFRNVPGRLSIILANPERFIDMPADETLEKVLEDAKDLGMDLRDNILDYRKIDHHYDFHSLEPGHDWKRPEQNTPVSGLVLAGDYTRQPHFATMEGAVVSGQKAASIILENTNPVAD